MVSISDEICCEEHHCAHDLTLFCFAAKYDVKVSVNDIVIKAVAIALRNVPEANGKWFSI